MGGGRDQEYVDGGSRGDVRIGIGIGNKRGSGQAVEVFGRDRWRTYRTGTSNVNPIPLSHSGCAADYRQIARPHLPISTTRREQAHAIMQTPSSISPPSFNFPTPIAKMIDHLQSRLTKELSEFELYRPPAAPLSTAGTVASSSLSSISSLSSGATASTSTMKSMVAESASNAASKASSVATSAAAGLSAVSSKLSSSASSPSPSSAPPDSNSTSTSASSQNSPLPSAHHLPLPLPPNPLRSFLYAWKIADEALHLSQPASYRALNDNHSTRSTSPAEEVGRRRSQATVQGQGQSQAIGREGGKDDVLRMGEGQGWEWYVRRGVLAGIYLRAGKSSSSICSRSRTSRHGGA